MKHIMNASLRRQLDAIGDGTNAGQNLIRAKIARTKFRGSSQCDAKCITVVKPQPNPITHNKLQVPALLIMLMTHNLLSKEQHVTNLCQELIMVTELSIHSSNFC
jgi:hypothetical protein